MLDIQFIRENAELVQTKSEQKGYKVNVGELLELDTERRTRLTQIEELRARRNALTVEMKGQKPSEAQLATGKQLKEELAQLELGLSATDQKYTDHIQSIPNVTQDDVPVGREED